MSAREALRRKRRNARRARRATEQRHAEHHAVAPVPGWHLAPLAGWPKRIAKRERARLRNEAYRAHRWRRKRRRLQARYVHPRETSFVVRGDRPHVIGSLVRRGTTDADRARGRQHDLVFVFTVRCRECRARMGVEFRIDGPIYDGDDAVQRAREDAGIEFHRRALDFADEHVGWIRDTSPPIYRLAFGTCEACQIKGWPGCEEHLALAPVTMRPVLACPNATRSYL